MAGSQRPSSTPANRSQVVNASPSLSPDVIQQFFANQGRQINLELNKQNLQLKEVELSDAFAHASLQAQLEDRKDARLHEREMKSIRYRNWKSAGLITGALAVGGVLGCIYLGQAALALQLVKVIGPPLLTAITGAIGGYSAGLQKGRTKAKEEASDAASEN